LRREVRVGYFHFWPEFRSEDFQSLFPCIGRKYRLVPDQQHPDLVVFSVFTPNRIWQGPMWQGLMPTPPDVGGAPTLFITGENNFPDMARRDFAISFCRNIDSPKHMRIPHWVWRLNRHGISPRNFLSIERRLSEPGERFCAFIYSHRVPFREEFVRVLSRRRHVDAPGVSMNNMPRIGGELADKLNFLRQYRFAVGRFLRSQSVCGASPSSLSLASNAAIRRAA
jgi:hypothetical protein